MIKIVRVKIYTSINDSLGGVQVPPVSRGNFESAFRGFIAIVEDHRAIPPHRTRETPSESHPDIENFYKGRNRIFTRATFSRYQPEENTRN